MSMAVDEGSESVDKPAGRSWINCYKSLSPPLKTLACAAFLCGFLYLLDSLVLHWQPRAHELTPKNTRISTIQNTHTQDFDKVAIMRFFPAPTGSEPADPIAKGVIPTARQSLSDLLKWKQRTVVVNDFGETSCEWQDPEPLTNPITLFMQLKARDVSGQPPIPSSSGQC